MSECSYKEIQSSTRQTELWGPKTIYNTNKDVGSLKTHTHAHVVRVLYKSKQHNTELNITEKELERERERNSTTTNPLRS